MMMGQDTACIRPCDDGGETFGDGGALIAAAIRRAGQGCFMR